MAKQIGDSLLRTKNANAAIILKPKTLTVTDFIIAQTGFRK